MRKADEIYQLGIARKAKPLKRLQQRYEEFQKRMLAAPPGSNVAEDEVAAPAPPAPTARKVLGERTKPSSSTDDPFIVSSSSSRPKNNGARIPVFRDVDQPGRSDSFRFRLRVIYGRFYLIRLGHSDKRMGGYWNAR